ncbi:MAG: glycoside hydrolase family 2, partial [Bacteroidales bacterium]
KPVVHAQGHMPNAPVVFENVYNFWEMREYTYVQKNWKQVSFVAEGIRNGEVVCRSVRMPSRRSTKLSLRLDHPSPLVADGSDFAVVIAEVTDDSGNVRRLAKENIVFTLEGEGQIIGDTAIGANPRAVEFGSAPVLIRSTMTAGKIKVKAHVLYEGTHAPAPAELEFESIPSNREFCFLESGNMITRNNQADRKAGKRELSEEEAKKLLLEVERQQTDFGETHKKEAK